MRVLLFTALALFLAAPIARAADAKDAPVPTPPPPAAAAPPAPIVFFDIAGPDMVKLRAFYASALNWNVDPSGAIKDAGLAGTLRQDPANKVLYVGVADVAAVLKQVEASGGKVIAPRFEVKGVAVLGLFADPAGNAMGLVEMKDGKPVIP